MNPLPKVQIAEIGEAWSSYRLATLGYESYRTRTGFASVDLRVVAPARFDVQVKTMTTPSWKIVSGEVPPLARHDLLYFLLLVDNAGLVDRALVVPSTVLIPNLVKIHDAWRAKSPQAKPWGMTIKHPHAHPELDLSQDWLAGHEDRWDLLPHV